MERYDVGAKLGSGSYAEVFQCWDKSSGKAFALKVLDKAKAGKKGLKQSMMEVEILRSLNHRNIIGLYDFFETSDSLCMVLEVVQGGELFDKIVALKHYSEDTAAKLVRNLLLCMKYLHEQGVAHRDIKPENLLLKEKAAPGERLTDEILTNIKLVDFGFASRFKDRPYTDCCGTPNFIAPEILQYGVFKTLPHGYDEKCDLWSIGVLAYILLCGYPPFHDKTRSNMFKKIVEGKFWFHQGTVWDKISNEGKDFVTALVVKEPTKRLSAAEALNHKWLVDIRTDEHLPETQSELTLFNAREKLKGAVFGIGAASRLLYFQKCKQLNAKANTGLVNMFLEMNDHNADTMDLSNNYLGKKGIEALMSVLAELTIQRLFLTDNQIDNEVVAVLAPGLRAHPTLTAVDLKKNPISQMGARQLLNILQVNHRLVHLDLDFDECKSYQPKIEEQLNRNRALAAGVQSQPRSTSSA